MYSTIKFFLKNEFVRDLKPYFKTPPQSSIEPIEHNRAMRCNRLDDICPLPSGRNLKAMICQRMTHSPINTFYEQIRIDLSFKELSKLYRICRYCHNLPYKYF